MILRKEKGWAVVWSPREGVWRSAVTEVYRTRRQARAVKEYVCGRRKLPRAKVIKVIRTVEEA